MAVYQKPTKILKSNLISFYTKVLYIVMIRFRSCVWVTKTAKMYYKHGPRFYCNCYNFFGMAVSAIGFITESS